MYLQKKNKIKKTMKNLINDRFLPIYKIRYTEILQLYYKKIKTCRMLLLIRNRTAITEKRSLCQKLSDK